MKYVLFSFQATIDGDGTPMFWSNEFGWAGLEFAQEYDYEDTFTNAYNDMPCTDPDNLHSEEDQSFFVAIGDLVR